jgi:hypothetical protein
VPKKSSYSLGTTICDRVGSLLEISLVRTTLKAGKTLSIVTNVNKKYKLATTDTNPKLLQIMTSVQLASKPFKRAILIQLWYLKLIQDMIKRLIHLSSSSLKTRQMKTFCTSTTVAMAAVLNQSGELVSSA